MIGKKYEAHEKGEVFDTVTLIAFDDGRAIVKMSNGFLIDMNLRALRLIEDQPSDANEVIQLCLNDTFGKYPDNLIAIQGRLRDYLKKYSEDK